ncbi:MAG: HU family DNA-binding protein [Gemmataceae bacterium]
MAKAAKKALTKSAFLAEVAEKTELSKKQIDAVMTAIVELVQRELSGKGPGKLVIPGLARISSTKVKAVKGGVEKKNPLTGGTYITKDKPAYNKVRLSPIKALKESLK